MTPLTDTERERVAATITAVKEQMPSLANDIKALRAAGFDIGWRDVTYIGPPRPDLPGTVSGRDMVLVSAAELKEGMKRDAAAYR